MDKRFPAVLMFLLTVLLILSSCYNHSIILNPDKNSGKMIIEYNLNEDSFQLLSLAVDNFSTDPGSNTFDPSILIDEEIFKETVKDTKDIKIRNVSIDSSNGYKGKIVIDFFNLDTLLNELPQGLINLNVSKEKNILTLSQEIDYNTMDPDGFFKEFILKQKEDNVELYNLIMNEAVFNFIIETPFPVKKIEGFNLSSNKRKASYSITIKDIIFSDKKFKFLISL